MAQKFYTRLTEIGQAKYANAVGVGEQINLVQLAVGDANGQELTPEQVQQQEAMINQRRVGPINQVYKDDENPNWLVMEQVLPPEVGGWTIHEVGIYDADGDLVAYGNYPATYKPILEEGSSRTSTVRFVLMVSDTSAITLKVDPSVVLATRKYVDDQRAEHEAGRNHPAATTTALGFVEKATTTEAKSGAADKFPDAAGVLAAMTHFGLAGGANRSERLNELITPGRYYSTAAVGASDRPENADTNGYVSVIAHGSNDGYLVQYFAPFDADRLYLRRKNGVSGWSAWVEMYHTGNAIADQTTVNAGDDDTKFVTAKKLKAWSTSWVKAATETVAGMLKLATQAQVDAGTDDTTAVTPKKLRWGFDISLGVEGYIVFPTWLGGVILQWGAEGLTGAGNVYYPISFPGRCVSACIGRTTSPSGQVEYVQVTSYTSSYFYVVPYTDVSTRETGNLTISFFAIGH